MVSIYGLNKRVGNISFYDSQGRDAFTKPYSEDTAKIIDEEVSKLIESQYQRALEILKENKDKLEQLASKLLTSEVIFKEDLEAIFGKRLWDKEEIQPEEIVVVLPEETEQIEVPKEIENIPSEAPEVDTENDSDTSETSKDKE